jgi:hypothetical protein
VLGQLVYGCVDACALAIHCTGAPQRAARTSDTRVRTSGGATPSFSMSPRNSASNLRVSDSNGTPASLERRMILSSMSVMFMVRITS